MQCQWVDGCCDEWSRRNAQIISAKESAAVPDAANLPPTISSQLDACVSDAMTAASAPAATGTPDGHSSQSRRLLALLAFVAAAAGVAAGIAAAVRSRRR